MTALTVAASLQKPFGYCLRMTCVRVGKIIQMIDGPLSSPKGQLTTLWSVDWKKDREREGERAGKCAISGKKVP